MRTARSTIALVLGLALLSACTGTPDSSGAAAGGDSASASPSATSATGGPSGPGESPSSGSPTLPGSGETPGTGGSTPGGPPGAPRTPSDLTPTTILVGTITTDSDGSCYTLFTDDGDRYALVGGDGRPLARGTIVRVKISNAAPPASASCEGTPVMIGTLEVMGR